MPRPFRITRPMGEVQLISSLKEVKMKKKKSHLFSDMQCIIYSNNRESREEGLMDAC